MLQSHYVPSTGRGCSSFCGCLQDCCIKHCCPSICLSVCLSIWHGYLLLDMQILNIHCRFHCQNV